MFVNEQSLVLENQQMNFLGYKILNIAKYINIYIYMYICIFRYNIVKNKLISQVKSHKYNTLN
jgi:hypothetical protein